MRSPRRGDLCDLQTLNRTIHHGDTEAQSFERPSAKARRTAISAISDISVNSGVDFELLLASQNSVPLCLRGEQFQAAPFNAKARGAAISVISDTSVNSGFDFESLLASQNSVPLCLRGEQLFLDRQRDDLAEDHGRLRALQRTVERAFIGSRLGEACGRHHF